MAYVKPTNKFKPDSKKTAASSESILTRANTFPKSQLPRKPN